MLKIAFIGCGAMGEAILSAILDKGLSTPQSIYVSDAVEARRNYLEQMYGVKVSGNNREVIADADVVLLAIKPQNLVDVMTELKGTLKPSQLVISIIAGARIDKLVNGLAHHSIVRVMPNTPSQIGEGISGWVATGEVTAEQKELAASILGVMGKEIYLDDENYLDMVTAISGSGPAYVFLFIEALVDAGVQIGLSRNAAHELVIQTLLGSGHLVQQSGKSPAELRRMVTSPGGTTAAALSQFEKGGFSELVLQAVVAAFERSKELGN
jgi:pyrroline-5-carboxylate reductase